MLDTHLKSPVTRHRLRSGPATQHVDAFAEWLHRQGYRPVTIDTTLRSLAGWTDAPLPCCGSRGQHDISQPNVSGTDEVEIMRRALIAPKRTKRGGTERSSDEEQTVERLKNVKQKRGGLNLQEREELYEATRQMPQLDLEIFFAFDFAELLPEATIQLTKLGKALADPLLRQSNLIISGHTDQKGSAEYNQGLSERRAASVTDYLVKQI